MRGSLFFLTEGTETISVYATDTGGMVGTAAIDIEFTDTRTTTTTTTESNRDIEFIGLLRFN